MPEVCVSKWRIVIARLPYLPNSGMNCATGPAEMSEHLRQLSKHARVPLSVMPNAGLPELGPNGAVYPLAPEGLAEALSGFVREFGVGLVGGCCGTTDEHIRSLAEAVAELRPAPRRPRPEPGVSSLYQAVPFRQDSSVLMIGERTNANGSKAFREAMLEGRLDDCVEIALRQMLDLICARTNLDRYQAYTLCSLACDLRITQVVNGNKGVHAMLPKHYLNGRAMS